MEYIIRDDGDLIRSVRSLFPSEIPVPSDFRIDCALERAKSLLFVEADVGDFYRDSDSTNALLYCTALAACDEALEADVMSEDYHPEDERFVCLDVDRATEATLSLWHDSICESVNAYKYVDDDSSQAFRPLTPGY